MTQVFDPETGVGDVRHRDRGWAVPRRPGQVRRHRRLRRRPARVRRGAGAEAHEAGARAPREGSASARIAGSSSSAAASTARSQGETVTVEVFEPGDKVKVAGIGIGKGFQGTIKRHNFSSGPRGHGSHNVRAPGSIGASATPSRVFKGMKMPGRMGGKRVTPARPDRPRGRRREEPAAREGRRPGPEERLRGGARMSASKHPCSKQRARSRRRSRSTRPSSRPRSSRISSTRPCAPS